MPAASTSRSCSFRSTRAPTRSCARRSWPRRANGLAGCWPSSGRKMPAAGAEGTTVASRASTMFDPYELLGALQGRSVSFVVIGAFARLIHGTRELTDGIDITPSMREENLSRLGRALDDLDARRVDGKPLDLLDPPRPIVELETRAGELKLVPEP